MAKKPFKTIEETQTGRNKESINTKTKVKEKNKYLIKKAEKGNLQQYHVVKPEKKKKFLRSNPDTKKKNNLDPKIKK